MAVEAGGLGLAVHCLAARALITKQQVCVCVCVCVCVLHLLPDTPSAIPFFPRAPHASARVQVLLAALALLFTLRPRCPPHSLRARCARASHSSASWRVACKTWPTVSVRATQCSLQQVRMWRAVCGVA